MLGGAIFEAYNSYVLRALLGTPLGNVGAPITMYYRGLFDIELRGLVPRRLTIERAKCPYRKIRMSG